jgi:AraC-like DNA-binding protein
VFRALDVAATLFVSRHWRRHRGWLEIHVRPPGLDITTFEVEHGVETERVAYNERCLREARRSRSTVTAEHAGLVDLFVPVVVGTTVPAVLVTGPFGTSRPKGPEVLGRWRALTGRQGHPSDPEFWRYLGSTRSTLVLEGSRPAAFRKLAEGLARSMTTAGTADRLLDEIEALTVELSEARAVDRMWEVARTMLDPTTGRVWGSPHHRRRLRVLGLDSLPEQVVVGLFAGSEEGADPTDEILRRDALERECGEMARRAGNAASAPVGDSGIVLLSARRGSPERTRRFALDLAEALRGLARRRYGLAIYLGVGTSASSLSEQYQGALAAAESALETGASVVSAASIPKEHNPLGALRRELSRLAKPEALAARFERYLEAVAVRFGHRLDAARAHLEAGFERAAEPLSQGGAMDAKTFLVLRRTLEREAIESGSMHQLASVYRRALLSVASAAERPPAARRRPSLSRAEQFMREHYAEPLGLARVAQVAGFAPTYFSELFHAEHKTTFERYLTKLRLERARQLLSGTSLELARVATQSGFKNRHYFGHVFKRWTGETPMGFRRRVGRQIGA